MTSLDALRTLYAKPEWVLLEQVANGTGSHLRRWADAIAIAPWPSRGLEIHGFEVKVSRADWKRELAQPDKSAAVQEFCDRWWIVAPSEAIVPRDELPKTWGLIVWEPKPKRLVQAPVLEAAPINRTFLAAVLRNVATETEAAKLEAAEKRGYDRGVSHGRAAAMNSPSDLALKAEVARLERSIADFERESGVKIGRYHYEAARHGRMLRIAMKLDALSYGQLDALQRHSHELAGLLLEVLALSETDAEAKTG